VGVSHVWGENASTNVIRKGIKTNAIWIVDKEKLILKKQEQRKEKNEQSCVYSLL
jgi:hypothetical protein